MYCMKCGTQLPDGSKFCMDCGNSVLQSEINNNQSTTKSKLIPAKCTNCGATLEVDSSQQAAICPYCKSAYIVEQAVNNYNISFNSNLNIENTTININGIDTDNLLLRAKEFEDEYEYEYALRYYNQVLDVDNENNNARDGVKRIKNALENYIYYESPASRGFTAGKLQLKKDKLIYINKKGQETVYDLRWIKKLQNFGGGFSFNYGEIPSSISIVCKNKSSEWLDLIDHALKGIYPRRHKPISIEEYIVKNFNKKTSIQAANYYQQMMNVSTKDAVKKISELL
ncbi:zinc ribbon domain-containing protein [Lacrimispora sp.]|uniref:zinc ribbon domain-containing protein n=1 Tax=Lacrimispora sp. TaxID=2719234 RepID=UPI0032E4BDC0